MRQLAWLLLCASVVGFGAKESITAVAVTDSKDLKAMPKGNFLFFKSQEALPLQPVIVLTTNDTGAIRRYVFEVATVDTKNLGVVPGLLLVVLLGFIWINRLNQTTKEVK